MGLLERGRRVTVQDPELVRVLATVGSLRTVAPVERAFATESPRIR